MHHIYDCFLPLFNSCLQVFPPEAHPTAPAGYFPYSSSQMLRVRVNELLSLFQSSIDQLEVWEKPKSSRERRCAGAVMNLQNPRMVNKTRPLSWTCLKSFGNEIVKDFYLTSGRHVIDLTRTRNKKWH